MMLRNVYTYILLIVFTSPFYGQQTFTDVIRMDCPSVENQQKTGTCWSFSTTSFLESELMRMGANHVDLSEMYIVRNIYTEKAYNYILRQGKAQFGQGSLAHDYLNAAAKYGLIPEAEYTGRTSENAPYNHSQLAKSLEKVLQTAVKEKSAPAEWKTSYLKILNKEIGPEVNQFTYEDNLYSPIEFYRALPIQTEEYIHLTSFTHHPYYSSFILEIPDNFSNGSFYNVHLNELREVADKALRKGYTLIWDGDVSEEGFDAKKGTAVLQEKITANQLTRQNEFMNFQTTDDHLMHIVGMAEDEEGKKYYIVKNSWGEIGPFEGFLYMSEEYFKMKTVALTVHREAIPKNILEKLNL